VQQSIPLIYGGLGELNKREIAENTIFGYAVVVLRYDFSTPAPVIRLQQPLYDTNPDRRSIFWFYQARSCR
jgi:hypothetical protein